MQKNALWHEKKYKKFGKHVKTCIICMPLLNPEHAIRRT